MNVGHSRYAYCSYLGQHSFFVNFRTLDLNLLRVFDAVMAEGSLTRAAERLAMTQPAASHALKRLHGAVGEELLHRADEALYAAKSAGRDRVAAATLHDRT